jgi:hypothetical protein
MLLPSSKKQNNHGTGGRLAFSAMRSFALNTPSVIGIAAESDLST